VPTLRCGTNYLAPALLSLLLMPSLKRAGTRAAPARVVFVCSKLHEFCAGLPLDDLAFDRRAYGARAAYAQSKLAELLFVRELERRMGVKDVARGGGGGGGGGAEEGLHGTAEEEDVVAGGSSSPASSGRGSSGRGGDLLSQVRTTSSSRSDLAPCHVRALAVGLCHSLTPGGCH
jgi:hypothetical protein